MAAHEWTTPAQKAYLVEMFAKYLEMSEQGSNKSAARFWVSLNEGFFTRFPDLAAGTGEEITKTKERLKSWMRYRERRSSAAGRESSTVGRGGAKKKSLFKLLQKTKVTRPYRPVEVYQKLYGPRVREELMKRGYGELNEEAEAERVAASSEGKILTEEEERQEEEETEKRLRHHRSMRLSLARKTAIEMLEAESDEVKAQVKAEMIHLNEERAAGVDADDNDERTPEQYQHAIDQLGEVARAVLQTIGDETGWHLTLLAGGPMPRRGGAISTKSICFGTTALGQDFPAAHPNFEEAVKTHFNKYLKRAFPHEIRDARGLSTLNEPDDSALSLEGLISLDPDGDEGDTEAAVPKTRTDKPKRIRRKKTKTTGTTAALPTPPTSAPAPATQAPTPATLATGPADIPTVAPTTPSFASAIPADFDETMGNMTATWEDGVSDGSSVYDFLNGAAWSDDENVGMGIPSFMSYSRGMDIPRFDSAGEDLPLGADTSGTDIDLSVGTAPVKRPAPRPMHSGAAFDSNRTVGDGAMDDLHMPHLSLRPSVLFQAFTKAPSPPPIMSPFARPAQSSTIAAINDVTTTTTVDPLPPLIPRPSAPVVPTSLVHTPVVPTVLPATPVALPPSKHESWATIAQRKRQAALAALQVIVAPATATSAVLAASTATAPSANAPVAPPAAVAPSAATSAALAASIVTPTAVDAPVAAPIATPTALVAPAAATSVALAAAATATPTAVNALVAPPAAVVPLSDATPVTVPTAAAPLAAPAPQPQYIMSRPMANVPKGHPLAPQNTKKSTAKTASKAKTAPKAKAKAGDAASKPADVVELPPPALDENSAPVMSEAARIESARIRGEEERMRKERAELRKREKAMADKVLALDAEEKRLAALRHNPAGGADLFIVERPKRAVRATRHADGTPIIRPVRATRGELAGAAQLATAVDPNVTQEEVDKELTRRLAGKKRKAADAAPASKPRATNALNGAPSSCFFMSLVWWSYTCYFGTIAHSNDMGLALKCDGSMGLQLKIKSTTVKGKVVAAGGAGGCAGAAARELRGVARGGARPRAVRGRGEVACGAERWVGRGSARGERRRGPGYRRLKMGCISAVSGRRAEGDARKKGLGSQNLQALRRVERRAVRRGGGLGAWKAVQEAYRCDERQVRG
ncbi:hypothetical protein B0H12DRAFT_1299152 [Mycena haematopus]|nr:hypothetical protein B0H12DRAFT_1299152 [Mycena haematopus]